MGAPAAIRPGGPSAHRCRLPAPSIFRRSVRPLTTGLERAAQRGSVGTSGTTRALRAKQVRLGGPLASEPTAPRAGSIGRDRRCLTGLLRAAARGGVEASRRHPRRRQPAEPWGVGGRARPARAQAGRVRARERPAGSGGAGVCTLAGGRPNTGQAACVCGWGAQQPGGGAPLCLRQSESGASAGARQRAHSRAARRARRAPDLEPVQSR